MKTGNVSRETFLDILSSIMFKMINLVKTINMCSNNNKYNQNKEQNYSYLYNSYKKVSRETFL